MATARLRVFPHPEEDQEDSSNPSITIRLSELYPLLAQAYRDNYVWLRDFEDDELWSVTIFTRLCERSRIAALRHDGGLGLVCGVRKLYCNEVQVAVCDSPLRNPVSKVFESRLMAIKRSVSVR